MYEHTSIHYKELLADLASKFFPIFVTIFAFLLIGYICGRFHVLPTGRGRSVLSTYIFNLALPAGIFYNVLTVQGINSHPALNFESLGQFLAGISIVKVVVYVLVAVPGLLVVFSRGGNWAAVFLIALSAVHSNDFGIGQPLLHALFDNSSYDNSTRMYPQYMETSMVLTYTTFAPLTIFFLELKRNRELSLSWSKSLLYAFLRSLLRPIILAAVLGLLLRFILGLTNPSDHVSEDFSKWIGDGVLQKLSNTISPIYLIYMGLTLVGSVKNHCIDLRQVMTIVLITVMKIAISPLLLKILQLWLKEDTGTSSSLSILFYLYGTLPTSPVIVVFASQYGLVTPTFALIVLCTTLCFAPVSTLFLALYYVRWCQLFDDETTKLVNSVTAGVGYTSFAIALWVILTLVILQRYKKTMYRPLILQVFCLVVFSLLTASISINELTALQAKSVTFVKALTECVYSLLGGGYLFILGFAHHSSRAHTNKIIGYYTLTCTLVPTILLTLTCFPYPDHKVRKHDYIWDYKNNISTAFLACKIVLLFASIFLGFLPLSLRYFGRHGVMNNTLVRSGYDRIEATSDLSTGMRNFHNDKMGRSVSSDPDLDLSPREGHNFQVAGFLSIVVALLSMLLNMWGLFQSNNSLSKLYLGAVILHKFLWLFSAIMLFIIFGLVISEVKEKLASLADIALAHLFKDDFTLPTVESLRPETLLTCQRFRQYHLKACVNSISQSVDGTLGQVYEEVFMGSELVKWLINVGLAEDRHDACEYGTRLIEGRVMEHIDKKKKFYDREYIYRFVKLPATMSNSPFITNETDPLGDSSDEAFQISRQDTRSLPPWF